MGVCTNYVETSSQKLKLKNFTGENPGIVGIIMWPFVERAKALPLIYHELAEFGKEKFPNFVSYRTIKVFKQPILQFHFTLSQLKWICRMKKLDFVDENSGPYEDFAKVMEASNSETVDYENI